MKLTCRYVPVAVLCYIVRLFTGKCSHAWFTPIQLLKTNGTLIYIGYYAKQHHR